MTKIYLGRVNTNNSIASGEAVYLSKHTWDCHWYWGFGYLGNKRLHFHFESFLKSSEYASLLFSKTNISDKEWWVIRDLFVQAYALKKAAEVYQYGGHQTSLDGVTNVIIDSEMSKRLNADLEKVLDVLWEYVCKAAQEKSGESK